MIIINDIIFNQNIENNNIIEEINQFFNRLQKEGWKVITAASDMSYDLESVILITNSAANGKKRKTQEFPAFL